MKARINHVRLIAVAFATTALAACNTMIEGPTQAPAVPQPSETTIRLPELATSDQGANANATELETIVNNTHVATWAYHTASASTLVGERWYISMLQRSSLSNVYSLGPTENGRAGWWTVGIGVAKLNASLSTVSFPSNLDNDPSNTFWDAGLQHNVTDAQIHADRRGIEGKTIPVKWYFFQAPNGSWYIVYALGSPLSVYRFALGNGDYDWRPVDVVGYSVAFSPTSGGSGVSVSFSKANCGDVTLDQIVASYNDTNLFGDTSFRPACNEFSTMAETPLYFTHKELSGQNGTLWALLKPSLLADLSTGYGADAWRNFYGSPRTATSGYRTPQHNHDISPRGVITSRHMYGDALDLRNNSCNGAQPCPDNAKTRDEWMRMFIAAGSAQADIREPLDAAMAKQMGMNCPCSTLSHVHADWRKH